MLPGVLRLLGVDLDRKLAQIRAQVEEFRVRITHQVTEQVKETSLMIRFTLVGAISAIATFIIVLMVLYRKAEMYKGPFAALAVVGVAMAFLASVIFLLAFGRGNRRPAAACGLASDRFVAFAPATSADICRIVCGVAFATCKYVSLRRPDASIFDKRGRCR
jgi:hypothetical protein